MDRKEGSDLKEKREISAETSQCFHWPISYMKKETYKKGDVIFRIGDKADKMFYIIKGAIKLPEINKIVREGEVIGEMGLFSPYRERMASAICFEDLEVYTLGKDDIVDLARKDCTVVIDLMQLSFQRFIENIRREVEAKERIRSELRIATEIQMSMLPRTFPPFPEREEFDIYATMDPAKEVGGDFYDFFFIGEKKLCFLIGDVSGKGVPAALFMAISKALLKTEAQRGLSASEILERVNKALYPDNDACMFVTVFCVILDTETGQIEYSNGGHNPPLIGNKERGFEYLEVPKGCVVGAMPESRYQTREMKMREGDVIFLYTDGVTEAMNSEKRMFSEGRLKECLNRLKDRSIIDIIQGVRTEIKIFAEEEPQSDDITMVAVRFKARI